MVNQYLNWHSRAGEDRFATHDVGIHDDQRLLGCHALILAPQRRQLALKPPPNASADAGRAAGLYPLPSGIRTPCPSCRIGKLTTG
jgi:hypothetical protein